MGKVVYEMPRERRYEIKADIMLRLSTGRNDGCHVGISNVGNGMVRVCLFSPHGGETNYEPVVSDTMPADQLVGWLQEHQDY